MSRKVNRYDNSSVGTDYGLRFYFWASDDVSETLRNVLQERLQNASFPENPRDATRPSEHMAKGYLGMPVRTKLVDLFETYTNTIGREIEPYRFDYPSLSRVLLSANSFFARLGDKYKLYARDMDHWTSRIASVASYSTFNVPPEPVTPPPQPSGEASSEEESPQGAESPTGSGTEREPPETASQEAYAQLRDKIKDDIQQEVRAIQSVEEFKDRVTQAVVYDWYFYKFLQDAEAIDAVLEIVDIVTRTYLSKPDKDLLTIREHERDIDFVPIEQTPRPEQLLEEAYNGLKPVLSEYDRDSYHAFAQMIARNSD